MYVFLFALFNEEHEVFLPKYSQTAIFTSCCSLREGSKALGITIYPFLMTISNIAKAELVRNRG